MYALSRLTSESSTATNASGSTEQTDLSGDDISIDCAKTSKTHTGEGFRHMGAVRNAPTIDVGHMGAVRNVPTIDVGHMGAVRNAPTIDVGHMGAVRNAPTIDSKYQGGNLHHVEESEHEGYQSTPSSERAVRYPQGGNSETNRESLPLLSRSKKEYLVLDIIRSEEFKKSFASEYAEIVKFRKNYRSLKKIFLTLAVLNIILIICAVSVMPVILVSFRLDNSLEKSHGNGLSNKDSFDALMEQFLFSKLDSPRARDLMRQHIFCGDCRHLGNAKTYKSRDFDKTGRTDCCENDIFTNIQNLKADTSQKFAKYDSDIQTVGESIDKLEGAVINLQLKEFNKTGNATGQQLQNSLQKTLVHQRVENNNKLLNKLLNWKRSSMQLTGTVNRGQIVWEKDVSNGNGMLDSSEGIRIKNGGTYFLYTKIEFSKKLCSGTETFGYHVMEEKGSGSFPVAHVKLRCSTKGWFEQSLNIQKVVDVPIGETASFYIKHKPTVPAYVSKVPKTHVFGVIEI